MARLAYLDEAGTGKIDVEPYVVMVGVIVEVDGQVWEIEERLTALKRKYGVDPTATFHAKDIYHGNGAFAREKCSRNERNELLADILAIVPDFNLPVSIGFDYRVGTKETHPGYRDGFYLEQSIKLATLRCVVGIEAWIRNRIGGECCLLIFEDSPARQAVKEAYKSIKAKEVPERGGRFFPLSRIIETPAFAEKSESAILQVADAIAFAESKRIRGKAEDFLLDSMDKLASLIIIPQVEMLGGLIPPENIKVIEA